jgi:hypothetical protein
MDRGRLAGMGNMHADSHYFTGDNEMNNLIEYECQVWDSVTHEWARVTVVAEEPGTPVDYENVAKIGEQINKAVSTALEEEDGAWIMTDAHAMTADGEQVVMVQLRALTGDDISVILAVAL